LLTFGRGSDVIEQSASVDRSLGNAAALSFVHVSKRFPKGEGGSLKVLCDISFDVPADEIVGILGPSGAGKTTLLNLAAGLIAPDEGYVLLMGKQPNGFPDWSRVGYMFQDDRLLPWRVALNNVTLALEAGSMPPRERLARARAGLALVGLDDFANAYPHQLSGGMRSRVALARSLVTEPNILLMDEPFSRLDAQTRATMHSELLRIHASRPMSILFVTHDVEEAVILANRIVVLSPRPGRVHRVVHVPLDHPRLDAPPIRALVNQLRSAIAEMGLPEDIPS
jgi:ABC-type nitrate/sulfonate/bicarbonate transport system ATPase subunit